jgi:hypothetical protein
VTFEVLLSGCRLFDFCDFAVAGDGAARHCSCKRVGVLRNRPVYTMLSRLRDVSNMSECLLSSRSGTAPRRSIACQLTTPLKASGLCLQVELSVRHPLCRSASGIHACVTSGPGTGSTFPRCKPLLSLHSISMPAISDVTEEGLDSGEESGEVLDEHARKRHKADPDRRAQPQATNSLDDEDEAVAGVLMPAASSRRACMQL